MKNYGKLKIGYMINPDKVYYNQMDEEIIRNLESQGAEVLQFHIEEIYISINSETGIEIFIKNNKVQLDGFLSYGYMSRFHYEAYSYIVIGLESAGVMTLHTSECEKILNNKYEQSIRFAKAGIRIPTTHIGWSIESMKSIAAEYYPKKSIIKSLDDYGGDGVARCESNEHLVNYASKLLWKNEYCLFQKYVPDSEGRSIRVLCMNNKAVALAEYVDLSNNFRSNNSFGDNFRMKSLMNDEKCELFSNLAEKAVSAIGNLTIAGVDILDSKVMGCVVLEINGWPDIYDIQAEVKINLFEKFIESYIANCFNKKLKN
jgi:ribosomal protein S6--L-glutamate ligase